jgi:transposase
MNKRNYRATHVKQVNWRGVIQSTAGKALVLAIDVAKEEQFAMLMDADSQSHLLVKWTHPVETPVLLKHLATLLSQPLDVAMEPTGIYADTLRRQLVLAGHRVYQISTKRVFDSAEIYDGVPSLHDAKAAYIIGRLYWSGVAQHWRESSGQQREIKAFCNIYELHSEHYGRNRNRLEAMLQRHWPEVQAYLALDSVTLEHLLIRYGSPQALARDSVTAATLMRKVSCGKLAEAKIQGLLEGSRNSIGIPCVEKERLYLQHLGEELRRSRLHQKAVRKQLQALIDVDEQLKAMSAMVGPLTTAMLLSNRLDPRHYGNACAYRKGMGLNLKEKSSGKFKGQLKITKRGPGQARKYMYLSTLRMINHDPIAQSWYQAKVRANGDRGKIKYVVALMRKLACALWHVGHGEAFDARKLFTVKPAVSA